MYKCAACGRDIDYRSNAAGMRMPVDPQQTAVLTLRGTVVHGWTIHFASCPARHPRLPDELRIVQERFAFGVEDDG